MACHCKLLVLSAIVVVFGLLCMGPSPCVPRCTDADGDGYGATASTACTHEGVDCDDTDAEIHLGADEICNDGVDNNCNGSSDCADPDCSSSPHCELPSTLVHSEDIQYMGAFRLPGDDTPPKTFAYGGNAMTFNPDGDPSGSDAYPGSLFVMGHDRIAYGDLPNGNQVAEIAIPEPVISANVEDLPYATVIQGFYDVLHGYFTDVEEIPKVGMQYLRNPATDAKIHVC